MGAGCASRGEPIKPEEVVLPSQYERSIGALEGISPLWWSHFGSRELERLIEEALALSPDLLSAAEKIEQAELSLKVAGASLFPSLGLLGRRRARPREAASLIPHTPAAPLYRSLMSLIFGAKSGLQRGRQKPL